MPNKLKRIKKIKMDEIKNGTKKYSIASFICGIGGVSTFFLGFYGLAASILAIVFANIARKDEIPNKLRTGGFVLGIIGLVFYGSFIVCTFVLCVSFMSITSGFGDMYY